MNKEKAKAYLDRKGKNSEDEKLVEKVMKHGRLYGDPVAYVAG